jgi:hypothetical protein
MREKRKCDSPRVKDGKGSIMTTMTNERELHGRFSSVSGTPHEVGYALGAQMGPRLSHLIRRYIREGPVRHVGVDRERLREGALPWLRRLPRRYQEEIEGLAEGSGVPLQLVAEWCYVEEAPQGCSAFTFEVDGRIWVGRNNDLWAPELWGYVTEKRVTGRLPTLTFGMEAEPFTGTGFNGERLWLHYNYLPAPDEVPPEGALPPFVLLVEALETCRSVNEVELLLAATPRTGGMMLFAVDGKRGEGALFECTLTAHERRDPCDGWLAGTNHYVADPTLNPPDVTRSVRRYRHLADLLVGLSAKEEIASPQDFVRVLAHPCVEQRGEDYGTVYANVVCPATGELWTTLGGYPAASRGRWARLNWPGLYRAGHEKLDAIGFPEAATGFSKRRPDQ